MGSRVESIGARHAAVEDTLTELPELVEKATADVQAFMDDEYSQVHFWVEEGLERMSREAETKHCIGVTHNVLDEHMVSACMFCCIVILSGNIYYIGTSHLWASYN